METKFVVYLWDKQTKKCVPTKILTKIRSNEYTLKEYIKLADIRDDLSQIRDNYPIGYMSFNRELDVNHLALMYDAIKDMVIASREASIWEWPNRYIPVVGISGIDNGDEFLITDAYFKKYVDVIRKTACEPLASNFQNIFVKIRIYDTIEGKYLETSKLQKFASGDVGNGSYAMWNTEISQIYTQYTDVYKILDKTITMYELSKLISDIRRLNIHILGVLSSADIGQYSPYVLKFELSDNNTKITDTLIQ